MKRTTTLQLLVILIILLGIVWLLERRSPPHLTRPERLIPLNSDEIVTLNFERDSLKIKCSKIAGQWRIVYPVNARANSGLIQKHLHALEMLEIEEIITELQLRRRGLTLKDYGIASPRARITLATRRNSTEILVGDSSPVGDSIYVNIKGSSDVIATSRALLDVIPASEEAIRERLLLSDRAEQVVRVEVHKAGGSILSIERINNHWQVKEPFVAPASNERVIQLLKFLYELRIEKFIWDSPVQSVKEKDSTGAQTLHALLKKFHLTSELAPVRVILQESGRTTSCEIIIGNSVENAPETVYARLSDESSVYTVGAYFISELLQLCDGVVEKRLFPVNVDEISRISFRVGDNKLVLLKDKAWYVADPVKYNADSDSVNELLESIIELQASSVTSCAKTNLSFYGLNQTSTVVEIAWQDFSKKDIHATNTIKFAFLQWNKDTKQGWAVPISGTSLITFDNSLEISGMADTVLLYQLQTNFVALAERAATRPADYFSKMILALPAKSIKQLTLQKSGKELSVARNAENVWTAVNPSYARIENNALDDILRTLTSLKAIRVEIYNPANLGVYGLEPPQARLTIDMIGNEVIRKSLLLGFKAGVNGVYAKLQGDDVVFVLETHLANIIARDFLVSGTSISSVQP